VLPGISTEQLRSRLNRMVADGLLTRQRYREVPPRVDYELTARSRALMPVIGALARWGYDWAWSSPRPGEDVNLGAIFRLAPGLLAPSSDLEGTVDMLIDGRGTDKSDQLFRLEAQDGHVEISEHPDGDADALVVGTEAQWIRALGPAGSLDELEMRGDQSLAEGLLGDFTRAAAGRAARQAV
jgi:hypothetical protein